MRRRRHPQALVYPGCTVNITDEQAFTRNPLRHGPLLTFKDQQAHPQLFFADAQVSADDTLEQQLIDVCVRCHPYAYGPLCDDHHAEVSADA